MKRGSQAGALLIGAILLLVGCDDIAKELGYVPAVRRPQATETATKVGTPAIQEQLTETEIDKYLDGGQMSLEPSPTRNITGDLRPNWIVTGRIKNNYPRDLKRVTVRLIAYDKNPRSNTVLDIAEFSVEDVPALEVKAFRRQVQLMVYPQQFRFTWTILSASLEAQR